MNPKETTSVSNVPSMSSAVNYRIGLSQLQVQERVVAGQVNTPPPPLTRSVKQIVFRNVFTLFNFLNIFLFVLIIAMKNWRDSMFIGVAICNTFMGIFQELRSKRTLDKLSILARTDCTVIRDGKKQEIPQEQVVLGDILEIKSGSQIVTDGVIVFSEGMEVDESLLTGESDNINKKTGDSVLSGSYVVAGNGLIQVTQVGSNGYAAKLTAAAKKEKKVESQLLRTLQIIIRTLTLVIIPVGILLFFSLQSKDTPFQPAVLKTASAVLGMIPEGLMLLTTIAFAVGAINLAKHKTLVQSLPCIETLARVDVLCLDKTGTITDGSMEVVEIHRKSSETQEEIQTILSHMMGSLTDTNPTANALRESFPEQYDWDKSVVVPFSSSRKWSGVSYVEKGNYVIGAPEFVFHTMSEELKKDVDYYANQGLRVLCLAKIETVLSTQAKLEDTTCLALITLADHIRPEAAETFRFFMEQNVALKVISGDNPATVSKIAQRAGLENAEKYVDMSQLDESADFDTLVEEYTVFGRVTPEQKQKLVKGLKNNKHIVCMTGDGVNDVLALREADCSVAMAQGSDAARNASDFVLLSSNFSAMIEVLKEGRRVINNIERVASLYLVKTIYSTIMAIIDISLPLSDPFNPFSPSQISPINIFTVGIPSFFLALEPDYSRPKGRFVANILENALPAAITILLNIWVIRLIGHAFNLNSATVSSMSVLLTGTVGFLLLWKISRPLNWMRSIVITAMIIGFLGCFMLMGSFFQITGLLNRNAFFYIPLMICSYFVFTNLSKLMQYLVSSYQKRKEKKSRRIVHKWYW